MKWTPTKVVGALLLSVTGCSTSVTDVKPCRIETAAWVDTIGYVDAKPVLSFGCANDPRWYPRRHQS